MNITRGKIHKAQKVCVYGVEGIGKSTFAAQFPDPLFIDAEGSTNFLDVRRFDPPTSWAMLLEQVRYVINNPDICKTLVIDTADWTERLCVEHICASKQVKGLEDFGYGRGYTYLQEEFGRLLNALSDVVDKGVHVVLTAHATMRKQELPDELGAFDRWELKLSKKVAPMVKEICDMVLFANYKTIVVNVDNQGAAKGKNKAQGGQRVMYTSHRPTWDAKNRHGLPDELPLEYAAVAHCFTGPLTQHSEQPPKQAPVPVTPPTPLPTATGPAKLVNRGDFDEIVVDDDPPPPPATPGKPIDPKLAQLMEANKVTEQEIQAVVGDKGHMPDNMPVADYPADYVKGCLLGAWPQVYQAVLQYRESLPF